jgi:hypothetical protein
MRNAYKIVVRKAEEKSLLGSLGRRWKNNLKMDLRKMRCVCVDWIQLTQDRVQWRSVVKTVIKLRYYKGLRMYQLA